MKINWWFLVKNIVPILSAIIGVVGMLLVHTYFKPDLRYEQGGYYRSSNGAITSLRLQNYGNREAEEIRISVSFPETILDIATSDEAVPFTVRNGGKGSKAAVLAIPRLVANESVAIFFVVKNPDGPITPPYEAFVNVNGVIYKTGIATHGKPIQWMQYLFSFLLGACIGLVFHLLGVWLPNKYWIQPRIDESLKRVREEREIAEKEKQAAGEILDTAKATQARTNAGLERISTVLAETEAKIEVLNALKSQVSNKESPKADG